MDISLTYSMFSHYTVFYKPVRGPYGPIMASIKRMGHSTKLAQAGELTMNFTGTTGTLTDLHGAVTYRIQVAAIGIFNGQENIGDRSDPIEMTTLEGGEQIYTSTSRCFTYLVIIIVPTAPSNFNYSHLTNSSVMLTWRRPDPPNGLITQYIVSDIINVIIINSGYITGVLCWYKLRR